MINSKNKIRRLNYAGFYFIFYLTSVRHQLFSWLHQKLVVVMLAPQQVLLMR